MKPLSCWQIYILSVADILCRYTSSRAGFHVRNPALLVYGEAAVLGQTIDGLMAFVGLLYSEHSAQGEIV